MNAAETKKSENQIQDEREQMISDFERLRSQAADRGWQDVQLLAETAVICLQYHRE